MAPNYRGRLDNDHQITRLITLQTCKPYLWSPMPTPVQLDLTDHAIAAENYRADVISLLLKVAGRLNGLASSSRYNLPDACRDELNDLMQEVRRTADSVIATRPQEAS